MSFSCVVIARCHDIQSSPFIVARCIVVLHRHCTLLSVVVICCCTSLSSSDKAGRFFLSKCLAEFRVICMWITRYTLVNIMHNFRCLLMAVSWIGTRTSGTQTAAPNCHKCPNVLALKQWAPKWMSCFVVVVAVVVIVAVVVVVVMVVVLALIFCCRSASFGCLNTADQLEIDHRSPKLLTLETTDQAVTP